MSEQDNGYEIVKVWNESKTVSQEINDDAPENGFVVERSSQVTNIQVGEVKVESKTYNFDGTVLGPGSFDGVAGERALVIAEESGKALVRKMDSEVRVNDALARKTDMETTIAEQKGQSEVELNQALIRKTDAETRKTDKEAEIVELKGKAESGKVNSESHLNNALGFLVFLLGLVLVGLVVFVCYGSVCGYDVSYAVKALGHCSTVVIAIFVCVMVLVFGEKVKKFLGF